MKVIYDYTGYLRYPLVTVHTSMEFTREEMLDIVLAVLVLASFPAGMIWGAVEWWLTR